MDKSKKYLDKVTCGCSKWSIGIGKENNEIIVGFDHYPNHGAIYLYDVSVDELRALGEMFLARARELSK